MESKPTVAVEIRKFRAETSGINGAACENSLAEDLLAVEEPLEIRLGVGAGLERKRRSVSITMRTPGNDLDLAVGFLYGEGIIKSTEDIETVAHCGSKQNVVNVDLFQSVVVDISRLERNFYTTSSCGVCGKSSLEALHVASPASEKLDVVPLVVTSALIRSLPEKLRTAQSIFALTGGLHASAIFSADTGEMSLLREDVGRHNALDKVIGHSLRQNELPLNRQVLLVSGRASFELIQKAAVAGIRIIAAIGAPSSLAIELARDRGMTVTGFVRHDRLNLYCGPERIRA